MGQVEKTQPNATSAFYILDRQTTIEGEIREDMKLFPQCLASNGIFFTGGHVGRQ